ncbi:hypothetical protein Cha6605_5827 [Chamaesiphon minutus PCC 6605]|uniref:Uncharacterized protein n=1 Tax=Chamaesiphon minutus (strain ATCC 27169 / PCC 6605) TaxID=1173020 RepID=K9UPQ9_CHAP6|nr:hypothetical protein Cha6605_5827 [Chamaesiphon minutus PCC 6605]
MGAGRGNLLSTVDRSIVILTQVASYIRKVVMGKG